MTNANDLMFPIPGTISEGLTKREYFAAMAQIGILGNPEFTRLLDANVPAKEQCDFVAIVAVEQADALINALNHST